MAKPFLIELYVDRAEALNAIERIKKLPGFAGYELPSLRQQKPNGHAEPRGTRGPYKKYNDQGDAVVMKFMAASKTPLTSTHLKEHFVEQGRAPTSVNSLIHIMLKRGDLEKRPDGYVLSKKVKDRLRHRVAAKKTRR